MDISLDTIISILTLILGGGTGAFFTWRYQRKKAQAEAQQAEASAAKELQDMYQQMIQDAKADREDRRQQNDELRQERDHYKQERNELREQIDKLSRNTIEWKRTTDETIDDLRRQVARNGRQLEMMRPFMCGDLACKHRQRVTVSDDGTLRTRRTSRKGDGDTIEPIDSEAV